MEQLTFKDKIQLLAMNENKLRLKKDESELHNDKKNQKDNIDIQEDNKKNENILSNINNIPNKNGSKDAVPEKFSQNNEKLNKKQQNQIKNNKNISDTNLKNQKVSTNLNKENNNKIFENKGKINTESIEKQTEKKDNNGSHEKEINKNSNSSKNGDSENIQYVSKEIPLISEFSKFNQKRNDDYSNILENNPESLFDSITPETVSKWLEILEIKTKKPITIISEIYKIKDVANLKIIKNDIIRTRVRESVILPGFTEYLEFFIVYFCKINNIKYKQGLNEIIGPMVLLHYKVNLTLTEIYSLIQGFVNKFLTNYYHEIELYSLKSSMSLIKLLLRYHDPVLYNLLEDASISPEMYAMSMLMTTFAGKIQLDILYRLWNYLILSNDSLMMHYIVIGFLEVKKEIINQSEQSLIVVVISQLTINSIEELDEIYSIAQKLRTKTPYSFRILANMLQIFKENSTELEKMYETIKPENFIAMPIFPSEIFYITYHNFMRCPDEECITTKENIDSLFNPDSTSKIYNCEHCDMKVEKDIQYVLLDLRILEYDTFENLKEKTGFLPNMIMLEQKELKKNDFHEQITQRFSCDKGNYHFVFLTSKTDYFKDFEANFYSEQDASKKNQFNTLFSIQGKVEKELNQKMVNSISVKEKYKLKEYDNLKKTIETLLKNNFPYISYVYGGFIAVHEQSFKYEISLLNHDPKCNLCKEMRRRDSLTVLQKISNFFHRRNDEEQNLKMERNTVNELITPLKLEPEKNKEDSKHSPRITSRLPSGVSEQRINMKEITNIICNTEFNSYFCLLKQHKGISYNENIQIMVMIKNDEIEIYKFDKDNKKKNDLELMKIESLNLKSILCINFKKTAKSIVYLTYYIIVNKKNKYFNKVEETLIIDFMCDQDARKFIYAINQNKQMLKNNPNMEQ